MNVMEFSTTTPLRLKAYAYYTVPGAASEVTHTISSGTDAVMLKSIVDSSVGASTTNIRSVLFNIGSPGSTSGFSQGLNTWWKRPHVPNVIVYPNQPQEIFFRVTEGQTIAFKNSSSSGTNDNLIVLVWELYY